MKIAALEISPELASEALGVLRDGGATVLGSLDAQPHLRIVFSHPDLPADCAPGDDKPLLVVSMTVITENEPRRFRLGGFTLNPWAAPIPPRRAR